MLFRSVNDNLNLVLDYHDSVASFKGTPGGTQNNVLQFSNGAWPGWGWWPVQEASGYLRARSFDFNNKSSPCLKCFYQSEPSDEVLNCESEGILGTTSNIIGSMQANEVLKNIISSDKSLHSSILVVNLKKLEFRKIKFTKKRGCLCN